MKTKRFPRGLYGPELLEARIAPATFTVTSLLDDGGGADRTVREAIVEANNRPGADTITFAAALFPGGLPGTITLAGAHLDILDTLTIKGPGIDLLTISGNDLSRIFDIDDGTAALKPAAISGLTLTDGRTTTDGGAIFSAEPLSLNNVVVRASHADDDGGGVFVETPGKVSIVNSRIVHNTATSEAGGGFVSGGTGVSVVRTTIADNTAPDFGGLLARALGAKSVVLIDTSSIANNTATAGAGGGLTLDGVDDGKIILKNSLITGNKALGTPAVFGRAGGLYLDDGNLLISNTTFSNNTAELGGALATDDAKSLTISGSRFLGNSATPTSSPGGGALYLAGATVVKITGTLFAHNTSLTDAGAIAGNGALTIAITGSSFLGNTAAMDGGAIALGDRTVLTLKSSILSGNTAGDDGGAISVKTNSGAIFPTIPTVLNLTGNKFTENRASSGGALSMEGVGVVAGTANLSGNLFQANVAQASGGAVDARDESIFRSKADRFIGNVASGQGGGVYLINGAGIVLTSSLLQGNVAGSSGGGGSIGNDATLTGLRVLENIAGPGGRGGGLRISGAATSVVITKSLISGNVANDGGGVFFNLGTTTFDAVTKVIGNAAGISPNIGSAP